MVLDISMTFHMRVKAIGPEMLRLLQTGRLFSVGAELMFIEYILKLVNKQRKGK